MTQTPRQLASLRLDAFRERGGWYVKVETYSDGEHTDIEMVPIVDGYTVHNRRVLASGTYAEAVNAALDRAEAMGGGE
jgi:hypothetical protein